MTLTQLALKSAWRKPLRSILMVLCIATTFLIYGLTASFINGAQGTAGSSDDILGVMNAAGMGQPMPRANLARIEAQDGVAAVAYSSRLRGYSMSERNVISLTAAQPRDIQRTNGADLGLSDELILQMLGARENVLVGRALAQAQGWEVGQKVSFTALAPLRADGSRDLQLKIAGIFDGKSAQTDTYFILAQYDYINALRARGKDTVNVFVVRPEDGVEAAELAVQLDQLFSNSATPTQTQSEKQFLQAFLRQYADVGLIVRLIVTASFATLLMIVINTMVLAIRERYFEIGVLKTLGFSRKFIMTLVMSETVIIFVCGGGLGIGLTVLATYLVGGGVGLVMSPAIALKSGGILIGLALLSGVLPTVNAIRIPVIAAFRTR